MVIELGEGDCCSFLRLIVASFKMENSKIGNGTSIMPRRGIPVATENYSGANSTRADEINAINMAISGDVNAGINDIEPVHESGTNLGNLSAPSSAYVSSDRGGKEQVSFALIFKNETSNKTVKLAELHNSKVVEGAAVAIPLAVVEEVSKRFDNTLYGYFIGKRLAFPIVENYVKNTWAKFVLERVMLQNNFFLFQFSTREVTYSEIGLSLITTKIGRPIMLDSYTSSMCLKSWGRNTYARALVEVSSANALLESLVIAIPFVNGMCHSLETIEIEYEWQPPRCTCKIFDHVDEHCPKKIKKDAPTKVTNDGFIEVTRKNGKGKQSSHARHIDGIRLTKPKPNYFYRPIIKPTNEKGETSNSSNVVQFGPTNSTSEFHNADNSANDFHASLGPRNTSSSNIEVSGATGRIKKSTVEPYKGKNSTNVDVINIISLRNSFDSLMEEDKILDVHNEPGKVSIDIGNELVDSDSEEVEEVLWKRLRLRLNILWGSRIILGWNSDDVDCAIISQEDHVIHSRIFFKADRKELFCSFIYAHNRYTHRLALWRNLNVHKLYVRGRPWCLLGDFNVALHLDDKAAGSSSVDIAMREFQECVEDIEISDVNSSGLKFTWNQKPKGGDYVLKKIDRIMANMEFNDVFLKPKPFKFSNILIHNTRFKEVVQDRWDIDIIGFWMFKMVKKLKILKTPLRKLLYDQGNLHENVKHLRHDLDKAQKALDFDPFNATIREDEAVYLQAFNDALLTEERFLNQKAKIEWLYLGDSNTAYFHKVVKSRASGTVLIVLLLLVGDTHPFNSNDLFCNKLPDDVANHMIRTVSSQEIHDAIFSIDNDKSPGPDGYTAHSLRKHGY
ncbi:hypothetical protein Tco_1094383 [Tanacetum coccineum]|uniref:RNA-directed DNA polymerase, eukaryota, reverse transcriptase zinc-binding domain protein n=1 Tax=Tanacetum coccineum TaxID=301880 RepID=A0ABQ5IGL4_9ASTR